MKTKVFISSTFADLQDYRLSIWKVLKTEKIEVLGMEKFGARKTAPLETCLVEVEKCDIYVGIIAFRHGSIENETQKSYTQLEYERAIELGKEIAIYFMEETALIQPRYVDKGESAIQLNKFKAVLRRNHTIDWFKEPEKLTEKIYTKITEIAPKLPNKFIRPKRLSARLTRFYVDGNNWIAFVGYLNGKPIEIFTGYADEEMFPIPHDLEYGDIIQVRDGNRFRYDFQYFDKYDYENTFGGLSHTFNKQTKRYCKMIHKLLVKNTELTIVNELIDDMDIDDFESPDEWKKGVEIALNKYSTG